MEDVGNGEDLAGQWGEGVGRVILDLSTPSAQLCSEPKTGLKAKVY